MIDLMWSFLVVNDGKFSRKSNRVCAPKIDNVPVPVRSAFGWPRSRTSRRRSWYWRTLEIIAVMPFAKTKKVFELNAVDASLCEARRRSAMQRAAQRFAATATPPFRRLNQQALYKALRSAAPKHSTKNCAPSPVSSASSKRCGRDKFPVHA